MIENWKYALSGAHCSSIKFTNRTANSWYHKHGSIPKDFNSNIDTSKSGPTKAIISCHRTKVKSVHFEDPYDHINPMYNTNYYTHLVDAHEEHTRRDTEEEEIFNDVNYNTFSEEELEIIHPDFDYFFHHQQWTQVSWVPTTKTQTISIVKP